MMLCKQLADDATNGVTFKCIKDCYNMLDIIELEKTAEEEEDEDDDPFNPCGYEELAQALRSVIWSNVDVNHGEWDGNFIEFFIQFSPLISLERKISNIHWLAAQ
jgi:hypothetical protein